MIAVSFLMMNFRSTWLWTHVPLLPYFQFPWRFLTVITFGSSLLVILIKASRKRGEVSKVERIEVVEEERLPLAR